MGNPTTTKKLELKPILRIRVRCKEGHTDPWLRRLYVIWAAPVKPPEGDAKPDVPKFALAQSDVKGYLSPVKTTLDPDPGLTMPMFPDIKYLMYFVRWPDSDFPVKIIGDLVDFAAGKKKWGDPKEVAPVFTTTGKDKSGAPIQEGIIQVDEDPKAFIQRGSDLYLGWTLFRDMPGTGSNSKDTDIQCPPLKTQVRRLQYHLGAMRYLVGNHWHPYSPEPYSTKRPSITFGVEYPNEGVFDIITWNSVLAFQRDVRSGQAIALNPALTRTPTIDTKSFDPTPAALDWFLEVRESAAYVSTTAADRSKAFADIPADSDTVVEETTCAAIKSWLTNKLRKPGNILVAPADNTSWMNDSALGQIKALNDDLKRLGARNPAQFNDCFRDARMTVKYDPGSGQIPNSIHKSGFAFDMAMDQFVGPAKDFPLYFVRDESSKDDRWIVYTPVKITDIPEKFRRDRDPLDKTDLYVEYTSSINLWSYAPDDPKGGAKGPPFQIDGSRFLNFTKVCINLGLNPIPSRPYWVSGGADHFQMGAAGQFTGFVSALGAALKALPGFEPTPKFPNRQTHAAKMTLDGADYDLDSLTNFSAYLALWASATNAIGATPDVEVTPGTKQGDELILTLRGTAFVGKQVRIAVAGGWDGGEGASNVTSGDDQSTADLTLGPKTDFPADLPFTLRPITDPKIGVDSSMSIPRFGAPSNMEWWHFQYTKAFAGQGWKAILYSVGWTEEGLLGKDGNMPIKGLFGLGYLRSLVDSKAG